MPLEMQQLILVCMGSLLIPFMIGMMLWSRRQRESSGWALLEERYPQKEKFGGNWQINKPLRLEAIRGYHTVDIGFDSGYLYLRPTQHGDILKKTIQLPWAAIQRASIKENLVELSVTADKEIVLGLDCASLRQVEQVTQLLIQKDEQ